MVLDVVLGVLVALLLIHWFSGGWVRGKIKGPRWFYGKFDDTDDLKNWERSGLLVYIDHKTGVQYLKAGVFGGITPRLDNNGKPIINSGD